MKLASFLKDNQPCYGVVSDKGLHPVLHRFARDYPTLFDVIAAGKTDILPDHCAADPIPFTKVTWLPPIPNPNKIICVGMNYRKPYPVEGVAPPDPSNIMIFSRHTDSLVGHDAPLEIPKGAAADTFDFEGEIVAVIGVAGRHIPAKDAMSHVLGYSALNEGSVRGWMKHSIHAGKNFHASGSWGPWITTADEITDFKALTLETRVNGRVMQKSTAQEMIFALPELISYISHVSPLLPGDLIATGSPDGTGGSRKPTAFLKSGDRVEIEVSEVGTLHNRVGQ